MPILPLDHPEPFAATLGVMFYPGTEGDDPDKARAFAAQWLATPLQQFHKAGHRLPYDALARLSEDSGQLLTDAESRFRGGQATGDVFKALFCLAKDHPSIASWESAIKVYLVGAAGQAGTTGSRSGLWEDIRCFRTVAHLWGAWSIRDAKFGGQLEVGYDGHDDFQCFLTEADILRDFGQVWRQSRKKSEPPLPHDVWRVPPDWKRPVRGPRWPNTGMIPDISLPAALIAKLKPAGRPPKVR